MNTLNTVYSRIYKGLQVQQQIDSDSLILAGLQGIILAMRRAIGHAFVGISRFSRSLY